MSKHPASLAVTAVLITISASCAEPETPESGISLEQPSAATVFSPKGNDEPLPVDQVFVPDAHVDDGTLFFRIQMLPGYYLYKDKLIIRPLSDTVSLDDYGIVDEWSHSEIIVDEWFGEQTVFFDEVHGAARAHPKSADVRTIEFELSYQGCKKDDICYMPQAKVLSVEIPAQLESGVDQTE